MKQFLAKIGLKQAYTALFGIQTLIFFTLAFSADEDQSLLFAVIGISLTVSVISLLLLNARLTRPLKQAAADIQAFYSGDIDRSRRIDPMYSHELAPLADAYNGLTNKLQPVLDMLSESASQFSLAAAEIATATTNTTRRMQQQEQETASIGNDISSMAAAVTQVAQEASDAANHVQESDNLAQEGKEVMTNAICAVMSLSSDVTEAASVISELDEKSRDINTVLDMINSVAEQTNLLALNAAIEAARAGEAGRGFAVVADEVRSLAARTQESTASIKSIIEALLSSISQATEVINSGSERTGECEDLVEQATITFAEIVGAVESLKTANQGIAGAAEQQSSAANSISHSAETINGVTRSTIEDTQHISCWCDELAKTAGQMNIILGMLSPDDGADVSGKVELF